MQIVARVQCATLHVNFVEGGGIQGQEQLASFQISSNRFEIKLVKHTTVLDNEEPLYSVC